MNVRSKILIEEKIDNKDKKFGANSEYFQAFIYDIDGSERFALFTAHELAQAMNRGAKNPEDQGTPHANRKRWWQIFR